MCDMELRLHCHSGGGDSVAHHQMGSMDFGKMHIASMKWNSGLWYKTVVDGHAGSFCFFPTTYDNILSLSERYRFSRFHRLQQSLHFEFLHALVSTELLLHPLLHYLLS